MARASVAFPENAEGRRWAGSVAPAIGLQAVTMALREIERLTTEDRAVAVDRAERVVEEQAATLARLWGEGLTPELRAMVEEARAECAVQRRVVAEAPAESEKRSS